MSMQTTSFLERATLNLAIVLDILGFTVPEI